MSKTSLLAVVMLFLAKVLLSNAGRTHYYGGTGYPVLTGYNQYPSSYGNPYGYGQNGYGNDGYAGYQDYDGYDDEDYDVDNYGYGGYQYPYGYQKQVLPTKLVSSPVVNEYVAALPPISKSVTTSSLYQTHPAGYGNHGYAGNYGYGPKYGSEYGNGYYRK